MAFIDNYTINNFNGGLLSPYMSARTDMQKYSSGCSTIENFSVLPWGGVQNRSGSRYITSGKLNTDIRLLRFEFNVEQTYIIELGNGYMRFFTNKAQIFKDGKPYEIGVPYKVEDNLHLIQTVQSGDILYITHPSYPPAQLMRYGNDDWRFENVTFSTAPMCDDNTTETALTPDAVDAKVITAYKGLNSEEEDKIFTEEDIGSMIQISQANQKNSASIESATKSASIPVRYAWTFETGGSWTGNCKIMKTCNGTTGVYRTYISSAGNLRNIDEKGFEDEGDATYYIDGTGMKAQPSGSVSANLYCEDYWTNGQAEIVSLVDPVEGKASKANVKTTIPFGLFGTDGKTTLWSWGAFSPRNGYPKCCCFYVDRLIFAGTTQMPNTLWMSTVGDYPNFRMGSNDDQAIMMTIKDTLVNDIEWIIPQKILIIGTNGQIGLIKVRMADKPLSGSNIVYEAQVSVGASVIPAIAVDDATLYIQRHDKYMRELAYNFQMDNYLAPNMNILCDDILGTDGVKQMIKQTMPYTIIWCLRNDGELAGFTYDRINKVTAWHKHTTDGKILSIECLQKVSTDEIWMVVQRRGVNCIEYFEERKDIDDVMDGWFLDSAMKWEGTTPAEVTTVLQGKTTTVYSDSKLPIDAPVPIYVRIIGAKCKDKEGKIVLDNKLNSVFMAKNITDISFDLWTVDGLQAIDSTEWNEYIDSGKAMSVINTTGNLEHLEGVKATALGDGSVYEAIIKDGRMSFPKYVNQVLIGLSYTSTLSPSPLEVGGGSGGNTFGKRKRLATVAFRFIKSWGGSVGQKGVEPQPVIYDEYNPKLDELPETYTGEVKIPYDGNYEYSQTPLIMQNKPFPMSIIATTYNIGIEGN